MVCGGIFLSRLCVCVSKKLSFEGLQQCLKLLSPVLSERMSDAWEEIQAVQRKRNSLRERLEKRKKERRNILGSSCNSADLASSTTSPGLPKEEVKPKTEDGFEAPQLKIDPELEKELLKHLADVTLQLPMCSFDLVATLKTSASHKQVSNLLQKFATQKLILVKDSVRDGVNTLDVVSVEVSKVRANSGETPK